MQQYHHQCTTQWYFRWDYPREYGENGWLTCPHRGWWGSSPRIRGESRRNLWLARDAGIIPANTGRIAQCSLTGREWRDHPREYGENLSDILLLPINLGSSPRIRGESAECNPPPTAAGIIPANTGRIPRFECASIQAPDHPREYGENKSSMARTTRLSGSSPRIRGEF